MCVCVCERERERDPHTEKERERVNVYVNAISKIVAREKRSMWSASFQTHPPQVSALYHASDQQAPTGKDS